MSLKNIQFPDTAATVIGGLTAAGITEPISSIVPTDRPATFILVRRVGGTRTKEGLVDGAYLTAETMAPTPEAAHDLLQQVRTEIHNMDSTTVSGVTIYRVRELAGPADLPDPHSDTPRFTITMMVETRGVEVP